MKANRLPSGVKDHGSWEFLLSIPYDGEPTFIPKDIEGKENLAYYHVLYDQSRIGFKIDRAFASAEFRVDDGPADGGCWSY